MDEAAVRRKCLWDSVLRPPTSCAASTIFFILCGQNEKAGGNGPAGLTLGGKPVVQHLTLLALMVVIVTIKVKIIIKKR